MNRTAAILILVACLPACAADLSTSSIDKDDARSMGGKADGIDLCEALGWYGDEICDDFCALPDPDCQPVDLGCGGFLGLTCGEGEYCHYEDSQTCGAADQLGECRTMPEICPEIFGPVCGCDGQTYGNACFANGAGTSVAHHGACDEPQTRFCGGLAGLICGDGEYCHYEESQTCGAADQLGECRTMPEICPEIFGPVCGCDGQTYDNACFANGAGTSVARHGDC